MICRALLLLVAVGLAAAQQEQVMHTNGRGSGKICGKLHLCTSDATCQLNKDQLKMCKCNDLLTGNGKLHCYDPKDVVLDIQEDPHLRNFFLPREFANLPSPCRYRLAHLVMIPETDSTAVVELFGENLLFKGGKYFLTKLTLSVNVILAGDTLKQTMQFYGDVTETGNYTLIASSIEGEASTVGKELSLLDVDGPLYGYTMNVDKDEINNLLKVTIRKLGITLLFRPPSIAEKLDNSRLPMVPGGVFIVDHKHWEDVIIDETDLELSSLPLGPSLKSTAKDMDIGVPMLVQYLMLNNTLSDPIYNDETCVETNRVFHEVCDSEKTRLDMLKVCKPIYTDEEFLKILSDKGMVEKYMVLLRTFFQRCESAFCLHKVDLCESLKSDMKEEFEGNLPKLVENLNCDLFDVESDVVVSEDLPSSAA